MADASAVADPNTGVAVYDSTAYLGSSGRLVFGAPACRLRVRAVRQHARVRERTALRAHNSFLRRHLRIERHLSDASVVHRPNWLGRTVWPGNAQRRERA
jgi:hypothetical protein